MDYVRAQTSNIRLREPTHMQSTVARAGVIIFRLIVG